MGIHFLRGQIKGGRGKIIAVMVIWVCETSCHVGWVWENQGIPWRRRVEEHSLAAKHPSSFSCLNCHDMCVCVLTDRTVMAIQAPSGTQLKAEHVGIIMYSVY